MSIEIFLEFPDFCISIWPEHCFAHCRVPSGCARDIPTTDSECTQSANSHFVLRHCRLPFGTFFLIEWDTQSCSNSRLAKSSSGHYSHGSDQTVFNSLILLFNSVIHQKKSGNSRKYFSVFWMPFLGI